MKEYIPIPSEIRRLMRDPDVELMTLDSYINSGTSGRMFHSYSAQFIKRLKGVGINNFIRLKEEFEKCQNKSSNLSSSLRTIVQGHYTFFMDGLKSAEEKFNAAPDELKENLESGGYLEIEVPDET